MCNDSCSTTHTCDVTHLFPQSNRPRRPLAAVCAKAKLHFPISNTTMTELLILDGDTETLLSAIILIVDKHQDLSAAACSPRRKAQPYILLPLGSDSQLALIVAK